LLAGPFAYVDNLLIFGILSCMQGETLTASGPPALLLPIASAVETPVTVPARISSTLSRRLTFHRVYFHPSGLHASQSCPISVTLYYLISVLPLATWLSLFPCAVGPQFLTTGTGRMCNHYPLCRVRSVQPDSHRGRHSQQLVRPLQPCDFVNIKASGGQVILFHDLSDSDLLVLGDGKAHGGNAVHHDPIPWLDQLGAIAQYL
jgi:hypothetical protein